MCWFDICVGVIPVCVDVIFVCVSVTPVCVGLISVCVGVIPVCVGVIFVCVGVTPVCVGVISVCVACPLSSSCLGRGVLPGCAGLPSLYPPPLLNTDSDVAKQRLQLVKGETTDSH